MCLLICIRYDDGALVVAANRDERYDRPTRPPHRWDTSPAVLAGRDERAGGTWLAVTERGLVAAVTNRPTPGGDAAGLPTRGGLPLLACRHRSAGEARIALQGHLQITRYNGFNLLAADVGGAFFVDASLPKPRFIDVPAGVHMVANQGFDDLTDPRVVRTRALLAELGLANVPRGAELDERLMRICRDHDGHGDADAGPEGVSPAWARPSLCMHGQAGGTVSSTILTLSPAGLLERYVHADGPPCRTEYQQISRAF